MHNTAFLVVFTDPCVRGFDNGVYTQNLKKKLYVFSTLCKRPQIMHILFSHFYLGE